MLLIRKIKDDRILIDIGLICLVLGLLGLHEGKILSGDTSNTFWINGFVVAISATFLGLSMALNLVGIWRIGRKNRS